MIDFACKKFNFSFSNKLNCWGLFVFVLC